MLNQLAFKMYLKPNSWRIQERHDEIWPELKQCSLTQSKLYHITTIRNGLSFAFRTTEGLPVTDESIVQMGENERLMYSPIITKMTNNVSPV